MTPGAGSWRPAPQLRTQNRSAPNMNIRSRRTCLNSVNKDISDLIKNAAYPYDEHLYPVSSQFDLAFVQALFGQGPHFLVATKI